MKPLGHLAGGYLVTRGLLEYLQVEPADRRKLLVIGSLAGLLPDMDALLYLAYSRDLQFGDEFDHHRWVSHTFPLYWGPGLLAYLYGRAKNRPWLSHLALITTTGATVHLLQDTIGSGTGLMWAWPFSRRMGGICTLHVKGGQAWLEAYRRHPIAWVERGIIVLGVVTFLASLIRGDFR
jgi:hypothetical protein